VEFRCAIIGLGRIGCGFDDDPNKKSINTHAGAYVSKKNVKLVALCDIDTFKLTKYGKKYNVSELYTDYKKMFTESQLDCVSICTLSDSHLEIVKEAVKHNVKGIFLEKPISNSLSDAKEIVRICKKHKVKLQIDFQRRFDPFYHLVKKIVTDKKFGKIQHSSIHYGAGIANTGSHFFDLIRFLFGDIKAVKGEFSQNISNNTADPNIDGLIICENGVKCSIHALNVKNYGILELDILGSNARIRLNLAKSTLEYFEINSKKGLVYKELIEKPLKTPPRKDAIVLGLESLLKSIQNNSEPMCNGNDGYYSLEATLAIIRSARNNSVLVNLPLKTDTYKVSSK